MSPTRMTTLVELGGGGGGAGEWGRDICVFFLKNFSS